MNRRPVKNPDIVARREEKEALLFNPADGKMMCINKPGILVWDMSDGKAAVADIVGRITAEYDVARDTAEGDCARYLEDLEKTGFMTYKI